MFWDEEIDFSLRTKGPVKKGRRASPKDETSTTFGSDDTESIPPQTRKSGGWADEALKTKKNKNYNILEQQRFTEIQTKEDIFNQIPEIPDSDDLTESNTNHIAKAPTVSVNRNETYSQISKDLVKNSLLQDLGDGDYSVLLETLSSEDQLKEFQSDSVWTFDSLFAELSEDYYKNGLK